MARIATCGFELQGDSPEFSNVAGARNGVAGRLPGGRCHTLSGYVAATAGGAAAQITFGVAQQHFYPRLYIKIDALPGAGGLRIFGGSSDQDAGSEHAWYLVLTSAGKLDAYNDGADARTKIGTGTTALTVGVWYRLNLEIKFRDQVGNNSNLLALKINGVAEYSVSTTGSLFGGLNYWTGSAASSGVQVKGINVHVMPFSAANAERDGGVVHIDDLVVDDTTEPGAGGITLLHVTGQGTDNGWAGSDWRTVISAPPKTHLQHSNATLSAATTFTVESMASKGLSGVTIKSVRVSPYGRGIRANYLLRLRKNGVATDSAACPTGIESWLGPSGQQGAGWLVNSSVVSLVPTDTVEIGMVDGPVGGGTSYLYGCYLLVDWEGTDPVAATETANIATAAGTYVGNGAIQEIAFVDPTFKPTLLFVAGEGTAVAHRLIWARGWGESGDWSQAWASSDLATPGLVRVYAGGFTVKGASAINQNAVTFRYFAVRDNAKRFIHSDTRAVNTFGGAVLDNFDVPLTASAFVIDALFAMGQRTGGVASQYYRDRNYIGDSASSLSANAAAAADRIQSQGTGTFQLGKTSTGDVDVDQTAFLALSDQAALFTERRLLIVGSYVGDGSGPRVITTTGLTADPALLIVVPETATIRGYRFYGDGAGATSRDWVGGNTSVTAITAFDTANQFSVDALLNVNLTTYHYLVFGSGTDLAIPPEVILDDTGTGLTWVELTDRQSTLHVWSKVALPDPLTYYGGYKEDRVLTWGRLSRALSDRTGQFESLDFSWTVADVDRALRSLLSADATKYFRNRPAIVRMISDANRRLAKVPRTVVRGFVSDYRPDPRLGFTFKAQDLLTAKFGAVGQKPATVPTRLIALADFPNCPAATVGLPVPIIYGNVSDTNLVQVPGPAAGVLPYDASISNAGGYYLNAIPGTAGYQYDNPAGTPIYLQLVPVRNGKGGPPVFAYGQQITSTAGWIFGNPPDPLSTTGAAISFDLGMNNDAQSWRAFFANAPDFNPYGGVGSATKARYVDHDITTKDGIFDGTLASIAFRNWTDGGDALGGGTPTTVTVDQGKGAYPPIYMGDQVIASVNYHKFLVAGHAVKSIDEIYIEGSPVKLTTDATMAGAGGVWLVPGYAGWTAAIGAALYEVINGNRYCVIYGRVGNILADRAAGTVPLAGTDTVPIAISVQGVETAGDGTGTLISDLHDQYLHVVQNWILRTYLDGAWLATPTFEDDSTLSQINEDSFAAVKVIARQRISTGYVGGGVIGAGGEVLTVRDLIARLNLSGDVDSGFNRKCQFMVSMVDESIGSLRTAVPLTDVLNVFADSFSIEDDLGSHANIMPYKWARDYSLRADTGWLQNPVAARDSISITNYTTGNVSGEFTGPELELQFVRHQATAEDVVFRRLMRQKNPPRIVKFALGLSGMNYDLGDVVSLTHYQGVGATGWVGNPVRILRHEADPDQFQVMLECFDMQALFAGAFILGDESVLPASWPAATTAQKLYGYLCDETTGLFSDGSHGKRLR